MDHRKDAGLVTSALASGEHPLGEALGDATPFGLVEDLVEKAVADIQMLVLAARGLKESAHAREVRYAIGGAHDDEKGRSH